MKKYISKISKLCLAFMMGLLLLSSTAVTAKAASFSVPILYQTDFKTSIAYKNSSGVRKTTTVSSSGCGATSAAMVIKYYTNNTDSKLPETLFKSAADSGEYWGEGITHSSINRFCKEAGITTSWTDTQSKVTEALNANKPVIFHAGSNGNKVFTKSGHYIVLRGIRTQNGVTQYQVNDPNSSSRTGTWYNASVFTQEKRGTGADYCICSYTGGVIPTANYVVLKNGSSGYQVTALQYMLNENGAGLTVDGKFGNGTATAVKNFQKKVGLSQDGVVGKDTWSKLIKTQKTTSYTTNMTKAVQTLLNGKAGRNVVTVDGKFGNGTATAVKNFQATKNLTQDGSVGPATWAQLLSK